MKLLDITNLPFGYLFPLLSITAELNRDIVEKYKNAKPEILAGIKEQVNKSNTTILEEIQLRIKDYGQTLEYEA